MFSLLAIVFAIVAIGAILLALILAGHISSTSPSITGLIGFLALLVNGLLTSIAMRDVQQKVNGHLQAHIGHTDAEIDQMITQRIGHTDEEIEQAIAKRIGYSDAEVEQMIAKRIDERDAGINQAVDKRLAERDAAASADYPLSPE